MSIRKQSLSGVAASIAMLGHILTISTQGSLSRPRRDKEIPEEFHDTGKFKNPEKETPPIPPSEILSILSGYKINSFDSDYSSTSANRIKSSLPPTWRPGRSNNHRRRW